MFIEIQNPKQFIGLNKHHLLEEIEHDIKYEN